MSRMSPKAREFFDARGQRQERLSAYFDFAQWPEKAGKPVTRVELLAILTHMERVKHGTRWYVRLWRFLARPLHSGPTPVTPEHEKPIEATPE